MHHLGLDVPDEAIEQKTGADEGTVVAPSRLMRKKKFLEVGLLNIDQTVDHAYVV
jgi:hypothetical protein